MFILKKGHLEPGVYVPLRALFLVLWRIDHFSLAPSAS